jgi:excisionase family DNA binding protein
MTLLELLRAMVGPLPPGASLTLPADWLRAKLEGNGEDEASADLTIEEVALQTKRAPSTVRGWLNQGLISGAYKLRGRDWRIPPKALRDFLEAEKEAPRGRRGSSPNRPVDLTAWRKVAPG